MAVDNIANYLVDGVLPKDVAYEKDLDLLQLFAVSQIKRIAAQTSSATPGTRTNHAHGLTYTPTRAWTAVKAADDDVDNSFADPVAVVKITSTNVVVKSKGTSVTFDLFVA